MSEFNIEDLLSSITSNPELMGKISNIKNSNDKDISQALPDIISLLSPLVADSSKEKQEESDEKADSREMKEDTAKIPLHLADLSERIRKNSDLLLALKPYLKKERGEIIDSIVKMAQVANLMKLAK